VARYYNSMTRKCQKCNDTLIVNEKLGLMECVSGKHIEPINTVRPQWWNKCTKCGQIGLNDINQERFTQRFENGKPVFDGTKIVFDEKNPDPITCRSCGNTFKK
jgi:hypothetical protein